MERSTCKESGWIVPSTGISQTRNNNQTTSKNSTKSADTAPTWIIVHNVRRQQLKYQRIITRWRTPAGTKGKLLITVTYGLQTPRHEKNIPRVTSF